ncbi:MAG: NADPH-dependent FMN reductase [Xanthomonadales bacterium]|nr:NADPH-dependent FMN reductase [Xanthomonadales bacterium]NIN58341.1 NADPH-dependent FMN reductase [Xanthomonadales bacterium]NIN73680.1 NADPH-dependent FMN reductase [Xanthomonadales bacterium]NIO14471.1 NADPH-dependent FMN reductase [Xanthomonadales bacterium]NIP10734.1 NADPH-dependent FMN reductase [Xanthomonadales bacterium]
MKEVCVVYHSGYGHTARQAAAVAEGVRRVADVNCTEIPVGELEHMESGHWAELDSADAIIFGCPTYMGAVSMDFKRFMEATSGRWMEMKWHDKLAAGFTNSGSQNGDKQNTLQSLVSLASQHGMVWISLNLMPGNNSTTGSVDDVNRLGSYLGAMAQSNVDAGPDVAPPEADLETARLLGQRVAECTHRWTA